MFPGIVLYLSGFYTRRELSLRLVALGSFADQVLTLFLLQNRYVLLCCLRKIHLFSMADRRLIHPQLSGAFSGLLAAAIQKMNGIGGKPGWAWIFILVSSSFLEPALV